MGAGGSSPLPLGTPLEAKGKEEERGERRKRRKKREEEEGAPLVLGLAPSLSLGIGFFCFFSVVVINALRGIAWQVLTRSFQLEL